MDAHRKFIRVARHATSWKAANRADAAHQPDQGTADQFGVRHRLRWRRDLAEQLKQLRLWDGSGLPPAVHCRLLRESERLQCVQRQIRELEGDRAELLRECHSRETEIARQMTRLRGIGPSGAWVFAMEFFCWRDLRNRRQVGALAGLTPTPHSSGDLDREQGISKSGNRYIRAIAIELAWSWLRFQPQSELSQWFQKRFASSPRLRRVGIVALARKLLIALWRWVDQSILPAGAELKAVR